SAAMRQTNDQGATQIRAASNEFAPLTVTVKFDFTLTPSHNGTPAGIAGTAKLIWYSPAPRYATNRGASVTPNPATAGDAVAFGRKSTLSRNCWIGLGRLLMRSGTGP